MRPCDPHVPTDAEDCDPQETQEWLDSLEGMIEHLGSGRAAYVLKQLESRARDKGIIAQPRPYSAYQNTIPLKRQARHRETSLSRNVLARSSAGTHWSW